MVVEDVDVVVVEDVAALEGSDVSGTEEEEVEDVVVLAVVIVGAAVTAGSDASSVSGTGGKLCASTTSLSASVFVVAVSGCVMAVVPASEAVVVAGLPSLPPDEQADASRTAVEAIANKIFGFICFGEKMGTPQSARVRYRLRSRFLGR